MGEQFPLSMLVLVVVFVLADVVSTLPQDIVFPEVQPEGCTLQNGQQGHCVHILSCPSVLETLQDDPPIPCGFNRPPPLTCCPVSGETVTNPLLDISPPDVYFECGRNAINNVKLPKLSIQAHVLRPETIKHTINESDNAGQEKPKYRPGIPKEAIDKQIKETKKTNGTLISQAVGAVDAIKNAWPWMALLGEKTDGIINWFCGGVLINDQWILTALHCFLRKNADVVRLGEHDYNTEFDNADHEDFDVAETILFPDYNHPQGYHDLALLRLATKVTLKKYISPVCLPWGKDVDTVLTGQKVTLTGWGDTMFRGFPSSILQEVNVTVFPSSTCDKSYSNLLEYRDSWPRGITDEMICAGDPNGGRDACQGDSGGPIVYLNSAGRFSLAGIVSRGFGCGLKDYPGLYVNLHQPRYLTWIKKTAF